jgi:hypothetical protein
LALGCVGNGYDDNTEWGILDFRLSSDSRL